MSFYGDLSSIAIGDLFQNLEGNRSTGTFTLKSSGGTVSIYFQDGAIAMLATDERAPLMDSLVRAGWVTPEQMKAVRTRRRGSRKSLIETLVSLKVVTEEQIRALAQTLLHEDLCDMIAAASGHFDFRQGKPPSRAFDPEERRLELRLTVGATLLEAARRSDHWALIRKVIPSDSVHFVAAAGVECPDHLENPELARALLEVLDGTRNVQEATALFHHQRFNAYVQLAQLVRERLVRGAEADDLIAIATGTAESDPLRARQILTRGLEAEPQHLGLLTLEAELAERLKDNEGAAAALKMIAHLKLASEHRGEGRELLERARELCPSDTAIWERLLNLDLDDDMLDEALEKGMELVELYRAPGLHAKAREVLERLAKVAQDALELHLELARTLVDTGEARSAIAELSRFARRLVNQKRYGDARKAYEEMLSIEPGQEEAVRCIELIDTQTYTRRRLRRRRFLRATGTCAGTFLFTMFLVMEVSARLDYVEATSTISRDRLIEQQQYREALERYQEVAEGHPFSPTTWLDIGRRIDDLRDKLRE